MAEEYWIHYTAGENWEVKIKWQQVHLIRLQGPLGRDRESSFTMYLKPDYTVEINRISACKRQANWEFSP